MTVRGWRLAQLQQEAQLGLQHGRVPTTGTEVLHSALANRLLLLWAEGTLSAVMVQNLAHMAVLDGARHEELGALASAGEWGTHSGNCHRDISARFCKDISLPQACIVETEAVDPKNKQLVQATAGVFLPHEQLHALQDHHQFEAMFCTKDLEAFWNAIEQTGDPKLTNHPMLQIPQWKSRCIPIYIHGDGVEYHNKETMMVYHWGCLLSVLTTMCSALLLACFPKSCTSDGTWGPPLRKIAHSFNAAFWGKFPDLDEDQQPFPNGSQAALRAGQSLTAGDFRLVLWTIQGDHEFFCNTMGMPHWGCQLICFECDCTRTEGPKCFTELRKQKQGWQKYSMEHFQATVPEHPFFQIKGATAKNCTHDIMHNLFAKGVLSHLMGSILHTLCWPATGRQAVPPETRLGFIFAAIQDLYKITNPTTQITNLHLKMFTDPEKPWLNWPFLKVKASECKHLLEPMFTICKNVCDGSEHSLHRIACLEHICQFVKLIDKLPIVLTSQQAELCQFHVHQFLGHYGWLSQWAEELGRYAYHIVPKFHFLDHIGDSCFYINPKYTWCFKSEDFVGHIATMALSISSGNSSVAISRKLCDKYRHYMHLRLNRLDE